MPDSPRAAAPDRAAIVLRPLALADAGRVHEWASQERACRYQAWGPNTRDATENFVVEAVSASRATSGIRFVWVAIVAAIGVIGLAENKRLTDTSVEIGYAVHPDYWGRGLGTKIARAQLAIAFSDPLVERVQATCDPRNAASAGVLRSAGLTVEGTLRHTLKLRDGWRDSTMHSILRHDWVARHPPPR